MKLTLTTATRTFTFSVEPTEPSKSSTTLASATALDPSRRRGVTRLGFRGGVTGGFR